MKEVFNDIQVRTAIRDWLTYGETQLNISHDGYFSGAGAGARILRWLLESFTITEKPHLMESSVKREEHSMPCRIVLRVLNNSYVTHLETLNEDESHNGYCWGHYHDITDPNKAMLDFVLRCKDNGFEIKL